MSPQGTFQYNGRLPQQRHYWMQERPLRHCWNSVHRHSPHTSSIAAPLAWKIMNRFAFIINLSHNYTSVQYQQYTSGQSHNYTSGQLQNYTSGQLQNYTSEQLQNYTSGQSQNYTSGQLHNYTSGQLQNYTSGQLQNYTSAHSNNRISGKSQTNRNTLYLHVIWISNNVLLASAFHTARANVFRALKHERFTHMHQQCWSETLIGQGFLVVLSSQACNNICS